MTALEPPAEDFAKLRFGSGGRSSRRFMNAVVASDRFLGTAVETIAATLVALEIVILLAGVVARYVLHNPLIWSDELASILFLWLSMFGAVIALRRGEHMRMTGLVSYVSPAARAFLETMALVAPLALLVMVIYPAWDYASEESFIVTPALEISNAWRAAAIPVGVALMAITAVFRLAQQHRW
jgi:TRAP-type C4-dicarboxylate transport system permease small subunit